MITPKNLSLIDQGERVKDHSNTGMMKTVKEK